MNFLALAREFADEIALKGCIYTFIIASHLNLHFYSQQQSLHHNSVVPWSSCYMADLRPINLGSILVTVYYKIGAMF